MQSLRTTKASSKRRGQKPKEELYSSGLLLWTLQAVWGRIKLSRKEGTSLRKRPKSECKAAGEAEVKGNPRKKRVQEWRSHNVAVLFSSGTHRRNSKKPKYKAQLGKREADIF